MWTEIFFGYVCPSLGCLVSAAMYAGKILKAVNRIDECQASSSSLISLLWWFYSSRERLATGAAGRRSWTFESNTMGSYDGKLFGTSIAVMSFA